MEDEKKELKPVSEALKEFFAKSSLKESDHGIAVQLWHDWPSLVHTEILKKARPVSYQQGRLVLWVENSSHLQEVHFQLADIKQRLKDYFKTGDLKEIYFTVDKDILKKREQAVKYFCTDN